SVSINVNNPALIIVGAGSQLLAESFPPATGGIDPGETVTLNLGLRNLGTSNTTSLVGILRATGGVTTPSTPQVYGVLEGQGSAVSKPFTFVAAGAAGSTINATLDVADVAPGQSNSLGSVQFSFVLGATRRFSNTTSNSIPDNSSAAIYPSQIQVSGLSGVVSHVSVTLSNLTHAYPDDLDILLVAPGGHSVMLMSDVGGSSSTFQHITLILDDDASASLSDNGPITSGTYKPTDVNGGDGDVFPDPAPLGPFGKVLTVFNGIDPNGSWSLFARDDAFGDLGNIAGGWSLNITTAGSVPHLVNLRSPRVLAGRFQCSLEGAVGDTLSIQGSTDLRNWTNLGNVSVGAAGTAVFQENSAIGAYRFYRAVHQ
ncbi:MAG TPA: proprotein convertase P-domain-containing protein, partial [Candidatus Saccharimonadales bacterium]|nr:proprotein convertase P-domain-containing protein [Candidatus Saccharimonadales bacterium]